MQGGASQACGFDQKGTFFCGVQLLLSFVLMWLVPESEGWLTQIPVKKRRKVLRRTEWQEMPFALWKLQEKHCSPRFGWSFAGFKCYVELPNENFLEDCGGEAK